MAKIFSLHLNAAVSLAVMGVQWAFTGSAGKGLNLLALRKELLR